MIAIHLDGSLNDPGKLLHVRLCRPLTIFSVRDAGIPIGR